jgi:hypothetical protein
MELSAEIEARDGNCGFQNVHENKMELMVVMSKSLLLVKFVKRNHVIVLANEYSHTPHYADSLN